MYDHCLRDLLAHLHEWQVLMRLSVLNVREGNPRDFLPNEYRKNYHEMDKMIVEKHQDTSLEEAESLLAMTHREMLSLADTFSDKELFFQRCVQMHLYDHHGSLLRERCDKSILKLSSC